jgi:hypothetical protein
MSDEPTPDEKKIIVDEDWKSRVEEEKEALRQKEAGQGDSGAEAPPGETTEQATDGAAPEGAAEAAGGPAADATADRQAIPLPPPTLSFLVSSLYLQGMIALGMLPNPVTNKAEASFDQARHTIDMLAMLQEKTQGNRTPEESDELEGVLHELRMAFVTLKQNPPSAG